VRPTSLLIALAAGALTASGCGASAREADEVLVAAAASLTDAFAEIGDAFAVDHPDTPIRFTFAASSTLAAQILDGAPIDVLASADTVTMGRLVDAGATLDPPVVVARNRLAIAVAPGNPLGISGIADLADPDLVLVMCAPEAPCGRYAEAVLDTAGITAVPDSLEVNPRAVVTKVALGEADAGIVYATDAIAAADTVGSVAIPDETNVVAEYPIAVTRDGPNPDGARDFVEFVRGPVGRAILERHGFTTP
jgi:molybdate transport system substrate-binding protein